MIEKRRETRRGPWYFIYLSILSTMVRRMGEVWKQKDEATQSSGPRASVSWEGQEDEEEGNAGGERERERGLRLTAWWVLLLLLCLINEYE
jgi:hypothetical protein